VKLAHYALLRYCPDPVRGESANVGVLVIGQNHHRLRLLELQGPLRQFMPDFDMKLLQRHKLAVESFFRTRPYRVLHPDGRLTEVNRPTRDVLEEFTRRFAGPMLYYLPPTRVEGNIDTPFALDSLVNDLAEQFLGRRFTPEVGDKQRKERVKTILRNEFDACDFFNTAKYKHPLKAEQSVLLKKRGYSLPLSFSFDNGKLHVFEPIDALEGESIRELRDVSLVALIFHELKAEFGDKVKPYACLVRPPGGPEVRELMILREFATILDMSDKAAREKFFLDLHQKLHPKDGELFGSH